MIIKYLILFIIFKIINFLPTGKICNLLNFFLVVYLGSNHKRRLWNLEKSILKQRCLDFEKIYFQSQKKCKRIFIFVGDSHAEFYGRNFINNDSKKIFFTFHTGPTLLTTFGTSRKIRNKNEFPVFGKLKDRVMWSKKLSVKMKSICTQNKIKFIKLSYNVYDKNRSLNKKITFDDGHISNLSDLVDVQNKAILK